MPLALWALQAASSSDLHQVVRDAGVAGSKAASEAAGWLANASENGCLVHGGPWQLGMLFLGVGFLVVCAVGTLCCACLVGAGGSWLAARRYASPEPRATASPDLEAVARFIEVGGDSAIREAALQLAATEDATREWWVMWQTAHQGPRRQ